MQDIKKLLESRPWEKTKIAMTGNALSPTYSQSPPISYSSPESSQMSLFDPGEPPF
jgi:hypothetical protein